MKRWDLYQCEMHESPLGDYVLAADVLDDPETTKAKSEAITEQAEELELARAELRAYRDVLRSMTPAAQLKAALSVCGVQSRDVEQVVKAWERIREL